MVIQGLDQPTLNDEDTKNDRRTTVVNYFIGNIRTHNTYVFKFVFCEFLNLVNIVFQVKKIFSYFISIGTLPCYKSKLESNGN